MKALTFLQRYSSDVTQFAQVPRPVFIPRSARAMHASQSPVGRRLPDCNEGRPRVRIAALSKIVWTNVRVSLPSASVGCEDKPHPGRMLLAGVVLLSPVA